MITVGPLSIADPGYRGSVSLSKEQRCFFSSLPGVDVPDGYGVVPFIGLQYGGKGDKGPLKAYDKAVRQSIATVFRLVEDVQGHANPTAKGSSAEYAGFATLLERKIVSSDS
ncbi:hypothetical protein V2A60_010086 [Cordyceps javanica]